MPGSIGLTLFPLIWKLPKEPKHTHEQTRRCLLEAADKAFSRAGYLGANNNTISNIAGYAKGTIYNYFPGKRSQMLAL
jgi:AcrR family transcriptional regulator